MASDFKDFPLGITGFNFSDLYNPIRLKDLHREFWSYADQAAPGLSQKFAGLSAPETTKPQESEVLIEVAKHRLGQRQRGHERVGAARGAERVSDLPPHLVEDLFS